MDELQLDFTGMVDNPLLDKATGGTSSAAKSKRPTKTPEQRLADLQAKEAQLQAQIKDQKAKIRKASRKEDTRRKIVAGAIALEHMEHDPAFKQQMQQLLNTHVKESDKALFGL